MKTDWHFAKLVSWLQSKFMIIALQSCGMILVPSSNGLVDIQELRMS